MTDHPRFRPPKGDFEAAYHDHHGGALVHLILRLAAPRKHRAGDAAGDPMLALDRALVEGEPPPARPTHRHRPAVRAAVLGIFTILLLSGLVQVLGAWKGTGGSPDSNVATSTRPGVR
jgi:hypothetical protein